MGYAARPLEERFWEKVDKRGPLRSKKLGRCWVWVANCDHHGYGKIGSGGKHGRTLSAPRVSYDLHNDEPAGAQHVLHRCDNPSCVRPNHLYVGDRITNMRDMVERGHGPQGARHHSARLTCAQAHMIRRVCKGAPRGTMARLARKLGVRIGVVYAVATGKTYTFCFCKLKAA